MLQALANISSASAYAVTLLLMELGHDKKRTHVGHPAEHFGPLIDIEGEISVFVVIVVLVVVVVWFSVYFLVCVLFL